MGDAAGWNSTCVRLTSRPPKKLGAQLTGWRLLAFVASHFIAY